MEETSFGTKLKQLREQNHYTQSDIASRLYVSRQCVSLWERGETTPTLDMVTKLAELFQVPVGYFLGEEASQKEGLIKEYAKQEEEKRLKIYRRGTIISAALFAFFLILSLVFLLIYMDYDENYIVNIVSIVALFTLTCISLALLIMFLALYLTHIVSYKIKNKKRNPTRGDGNTKE